jgi:hypothetical protein
MRISGNGPSAGRGPFREPVSFQTARGSFLDLMLHTDSSPVPQTIFRAVFIGRCAETGNGPVEWF